MTSYSEVFGGAVIYPAGQTYLELTFSTDQTLQWPIEQAIAGDNVAASIMDLNATQAGLNVDFADARQVSKGIQTVFNNFGGNTITIRDALGGTILSLDVGQAWVAYLTDNSTEDGSWRIFQLGASVSVANASALAGAGLKAVGTVLDNRVAPTSTAVTPITWVDADRAQLTIWTGGVGILDLPNPVTVGSDWFSMIRNGGSGSLTITPPSGTIDDGATLVLDPGQSATIVTDGTNFFTIGLGQSTAGFFDFLELNVAGSGDFTLSGVQLNRISYRFIGVLTGNRNIIVPNTVQQYWVDNSTTGAFTLDVATAAQITPVQIGQNQRNITYCDGTDVLAAESSSFTSPLAISQGGTGATDAATAISNLGAAADTIDLIAGDGMVGGGDLSGPDRTFDFNLASIAIAVPDTAADFFVFQDVDNADVNAKALLSTIAGAQISGTPANNQVAVWVDATSIEGDANFTFSGGASGTLATPNITGDATELSLVGYDENDDGLVIEDGARITFEDLAFANSVYLRNEGVGGGSGTLTLRTVSSANLVLAGPGLQLNNSALSEPIGISLLTTTVRRLNVSQSIRTQNAIYLLERSAANADFAGDGQIWVEDLIANTLMFTDDSGIDFRVSCVQWFNNFGGQQTVNNSVAFVNITQLSGFQLDANSVYHIEIFLKTNQANVNSDIALRLNPQGGGSFTDENFQITSISQVNSTFTFQDTNVHTILGAVQDVTGNHALHIIGTVDVGAGDLWDLQFAQQNATVANTIVDDASFVKITKIGSGP